MAWFKRSKRRGDSSRWAWDPAAANVSGDQAWALLTNAIYFDAAARRLDTLGGGLESLDWLQGLATFWQVGNEDEFEDLVTWMQAEGHRTDWSARGLDDGDEKFAWDYCRLITVTGGAALARVIDSDRAWSLVLDAGEALADRFDSWAALADNYLSGRVLWLKDNDQWEPVPDPSQAQFEKAASDLLGDPMSPWNRVAWDRDRSGGVVIDGEPVD